MFASLHVRNLTVVCVFSTKCGHNMYEWSTIMGGIHLPQNGAKCDFYL